MNTATIRGALIVAKKAYGTFADYRDRKTTEAYEALVSAAQSYDDVADSVRDNLAQGITKGKAKSKQEFAELYQTSSAHVATLADQYRARLEQARKLADARKQEQEQQVAAAATKLHKHSKKLAKKQAKKAKDLKQAVADSPVADAAASLGETLEQAKASKVAQSVISVIPTEVAAKQQRELASGKLKKATSSQKSKGLRAGLIGALLAALAGVVYAIIAKRKKPVAATPPQVDDYAKPEEESRLVYSTQTPDDENYDPNHVPSSEEGATERDDELLDALEKQLNEHRSENEES